MAAVVLRAVSGRATIGHLAIGGRTFRCTLGRTGRRALKREGDGATPIGRWRVVRVLYRADRVARPVSGLPTRPIQPLDGWCDDPADRNYNRQVRHPYGASAEALWRNDDLYDVVVVVDHNQCPRRRNGGSAIFVHHARGDRGPTAGCVALSPRDLRSLLALLKTGSRLIVTS